ncbi:uncharacterized protein LOC114521718 [Dendronephthya gigantea]|uniref:uncharacterized protein LOC114521718 n=1 Tax=Dendronephthya gigantea TaxID=151771 RepID=UPI0010696641|nr:uncharacterized protein LOC114521718 [Dendronephthya gigantea]
MASKLRSRIQLIIGLAGLVLTCSGIILFASSYLVEEWLKSYEFSSPLGRNHCEYWAAIPTFLTGIVILISVTKHFKHYLELLYYLRTCCTLVVMVTALGVIVEETTDNGYSHALVDGERCQKHNDDLHPRFKEFCEVLRKADKMFYVMLFTADIVLVTSIIVLFAIYTEWMLFTILRVETRNWKHSMRMDGRYERFSVNDESQGEETQISEVQSVDQVSLQAV